MKNIPYTTIANREKEFEEKWEVEIESLCELIWERDMKEDTKKGWEAEIKEKWEKWAIEVEAKKKLEKLDEWTIELEAKLKKKVMEAFKVEAKSGWMSQFDKVEAEAELAQCTKGEIH